MPPVEVIPYATLAKAKEFLDTGGMVVGYGFLPSKSATIGKDAAEIAASPAVWGENAASPGLAAANYRRRRPLVSAAGETDSRGIAPGSGRCRRTSDAGSRSTGETDGWLHVLHRQKAGQDVFLVCNQNHQGGARQFTFRATASGEPECWDADAERDHHDRDSGGSTPERCEVTMTLEPLETVLIVFQPEKIARPLRIEPDVKPIREPIAVVRDPNPPPELPPTPDRKRPLTVSPVKAADPFRGRFDDPGGR